MSENSDLEFINYLKGTLSRYLRKLDIQDINAINQGYALDSNEKVVGLNLNSSSIAGLDMIARFKTLTHLDLTDNKICDLQPLRDLPHLTHLFLSGNQIEDIKPLNCLKKLKWLVLRLNQIRDYSPLGELNHLTHLSLAFNDVKDLTFLKNLSQLEYLDMNHCKLKSVSFLADLQNLSHLNLKGNQISEISGLNGLANLKRLDLRNNKISRLPPQLLNSDMRISWRDVETDGILLKGNPLNPPPPEIEEKGRHAVKVYLKSLFSNKVAINEVKVLLVGDGGAGKTTLVKKICGEEINPPEPITQGINIKYWETIGKGESAKVNFWDFGGQEIMHTTHQFFLSRRSLYIVVLEGRQKERPEYWFDHIKTFGGDSPIIVVLSKIDINPNNEINRKFYLQKYPNIKGFYRLSSTTGEGFNTFLNALKNALMDVEMLKTEWPVNWITVKSQLEDMKVNYISYPQYRKICYKQKIDEDSSQDILLDYLHDLGVMLHFRDINLLDTNVLEPEWVTRGVYKIINSDLVRDQKGILKVDMISKILVDDGSLFKYPPEIRIYFIELMKKFKLCYEVDTDTLLLPDRLEEDEPDFNFDFDSAIHFFYEYDFLHRSVMTRLMVTMHKDIKESLRWRTGVVLYNPSFRSIAVVRADYDEKKISIYVNGHSKRDYLSVIRHCLRNINQSYEKIGVTERLCLPQEPELSVSYEHLQNLLKIGQIHVVPEGSMKSYLIIELLEGIEKNTQHPSDMNHKAKHNPSRLNSNAPRKWAVFDLIKDFKTSGSNKSNIKNKIRGIL